MSVFAKYVVGATTVLLLSSAGSLAQTNECTCLVPVGAVGVVEAVRGTVYISQSNGAVPLSKSMHVSADSSVLSGPKSASTINFGSSCSLRLGDNAALSAKLQNGNQCLSVTSNIGAGGSVVGIHSAPTVYGAPNGVAGASVAPVLVTPATIAATIGAGALIVGIASHNRSVSR